MPEGPLRQGLLQRIRLTEGFAIRKSDPRRALALISRAMEQQKSTGQNYFLIQAYLASGEAHLALGNLTQAKGDLLEAVNAFDESRVEMGELAQRLSIAQAAQKALETVLTFESPESRPAEDTFVLAERLRARELLAQAHWAPQADDQPTARDVARYLDPGIAVVHYTTLPDRILCWVLTRQVTHALHIPTPRSELVGLIRVLESQMKRSAPQKEMLPTLGTLYRWLYKPISSKVRQADTLVFIPDRELTTIPFTALYDEGSGHFLIEDQAVSVVPSATLLLAHSRFRRKSNLGKVLLAGVGRAPEDRPHLPRLSAVEEEVREVARLYENPIVLLERQASFSSFSEKVPGSGIVHFAGHALVNTRRPELSLLLFHPGPQGDGAVPISQVLSAGLSDAALVVLSACSTMDQELEERERPLGAAGMLYASGIPAVLAGRLQLDDRLALRITPGFHRALRNGLSPAQALRVSLVQLLREGRLPPSQWAVLSIVGGIFPPSPNVDSSQ